MNSIHAIFERLSDYMVLWYSEMSDWTALTDSDFKEHGWNTAWIYQISYENDPDSASSNRLRTSTGLLNDITKVVWLALAPDMQLLATGLTEPEINVEQQLKLQATALFADTEILRSWCWIHPSGLWSFRVQYSMSTTGSISY